MEECELCGKQAKEVYIVSVEEVELRVCTKCAQGKKVIARAVDSKAKQRMQQAPAREKSGEYDEQLVENYGNLIHNARESMRLPIKVLAEMLNEKETLLLRIEQQKTMPSEALRKKLQKALGIRLIDEGHAQGGKSGGTGKGDNATIGDFLGND